MAKKNIVEVVKEMLADYLPEHGYALWNTEFVKEGKDFSLRVFIDKPEGISTDDCEKVSKYLSARLDASDPIDTNYYLVVSSPGMDRPLLTDEHFRRYEGTPVDVSLYKAFAGAKKHSGVLGKKTNSYLELYPEKNGYIKEGKTDDGTGGSLEIPLELISKVRLQVIF